jgi:hypothetical protein
LVPVFTWEGISKWTACDTKNTSFNPFTFFGLSKKMMA